MYTASLEYKGAERNFKTVQQHSSTQGLPYDYTSSMHFSHDQFARNTSASVISAFDPGIYPESLGHGDFPTPLDYLHIIFLYCNGGSDKYGRIKLTPNWSFVMELFSQ